MSTRGARPGEKCGGGQPAGKAGAVLTVADHGVSTYRIVIPRSPSPSELHAAAELQRFVEEITGAHLPIATDEEPVGETEIILGNNAHLRAVGQSIDFDVLGEEGFVIRTAPPHLLIAGGGKRGTLYGVYAFLEEHLGCRWFTPAVSQIPRMPHLAIGPIDDRQVPALEYRNVFFIDGMDPDWAARNRVNGTAGLTLKHGGPAFRGLGALFWGLIPPEEHFKSHPEWFSLVDGQRTLTGRYVRTQLCLTNEEMIQHAIATVKMWIRENPEATVISVCQNDGPGGWCECDDCRALEENEGGAHSVPIIYFVNRIAAAVSDDHPDVSVLTLAYSYSRTAPKTLKPLPNVIIQLTTGGHDGCCSHAIEDVKCIGNADFRDAIRDWFRLTKQVYIWDYVVNFRQYLMPFPNLHTLGPNIRFFAQTGVRGIFQQGNGDVHTCDMAPLKAYLSAKLLWNPGYDEERGMMEFLAAYYGEAAGPVSEYLNLLKQEVQGTDYHSLHVRPFEPGIGAPYLTPELLAKARKLFDEAESRVAGDAERLARVRTARLPLDYTKLSMAARVMSMVHPKDAQLSVRDWYRATIEEFFSTARDAGMTHWRPVGRPNSSLDGLRQEFEEAARNTTEIK